MITIHPAAAALLLASLLSCNAQIQVLDVTELKEGEQTVGIPFRVKEPYTVSLYRRVVKDGKSSYERVGAKQELLPSLDRTYAVNVQSAMFSSSVTKVTLQQDGTLEKLDVSSSSDGDDILGEVASQVAAVKSAKATEEAAELAAATAEADKLQEELTEQELLERNAIEAMQKVAAADLVVSQLGKTATARDVLAATQALLLAQFDANAIFRKLGRAEPFPGVANR